MTCSTLPAAIALKCALASSIGAAGARVDMESRAAAKRIRMLLFMMTSCRLMNQGVAVMYTRSGSNLFHDSEYIPSCYRGRTTEVLGAETGGTFSRRSHGMGVSEEGLRNRIFALPWNKLP